MAPRSDTVTLIVAGILSGCLSMWLYHRCSPQSQLRAIAVRLADVRGTLKRYDGDFSGLRVLLREQLSLAWLRVRLALLPTLIAVLPMIAGGCCCQSWFGKGANAPSVRGAPPARVTAEAVVATAANDHRLKGAPAGEPSSDRRSFEATRRREGVDATPGWASCCDGGGAADRISHLPFGPAWMRGWTFIFVTGSLLGAVGLKFALGVTC